ncbi:hypothetical protein ACS0TY_034919 [Phlomoides rotata]
MQSPHQLSRINLDELKAQLLKKVGPEGSKQYFYYLQRFLSLKLSKVELNKLCIRVLGRENIALHNQLIRSILRNVCCAKSPPPVKSVAYVGGQEVPSDGYQQNGSHISMTPASVSPGLSNGGDVLPVSPKKARSCRERRRALGPNGKTSFAPQAILENGDLNPRDIRRAVMQAEDESENLVSHTAKMPVARMLPDCSALVHSKDQTESVVRNDGTRSPLRAPLGVPLCPISVGGALRALPSGNSSRYNGTFVDGALLESHALRDRMEHIAVSQGLEGLSEDCANILNHGLDSYLNGIIRSCIELVGARSGHELTKDNTIKQRTCLKPINGVKAGHQFDMSNSGAHQYQMQELSLQDFRVAMELNPQQLGEDWPLLLERICTSAFEE